MYAAVDVGNISPWERYESVAQRLAMYYRRKHFQFMAILLPLAVGFILALGWLLSFDMWIILGMACGALAGLSVGVMQFRKFMSEYREIME